MGAMGGGRDRVGRLVPRRHRGHGKNIQVEQGILRVTRLLDAMGQLDTVLGRTLAKTLIIASLLTLALILCSPLYRSLTLKQNKNNNFPGT